MAKKKFSVIHNLESLTDEQRFSYLREASEFFGLDPDLNALDVIWMNDESSGLRKLTIYARRGTTDILRDIHNISVMSMDRLDIPGTSTFRATGVNKTGRQEVAIGSCNTEGLKGQRLAEAIMTSETRAGRRLTLKFVGTGILDESEVGAVTGNIAVSGASLAQLAGSPVVVPIMPGAPSAATGRDITEKSSQNETPRQTPEEFSVSQQVLRDEAVRQLRDKAAPKLAENPIPEDITPAVASVTPVPEVAPKPAKQRGRPRKKAGTVSFEIHSAPIVPETGTFVPKKGTDAPSCCIVCGVPLKDHDYAEGGGGYVCRPEDLTKNSPAPETASAAVSALETAQPKTSAAPTISDPMRTAIGSATIIMNSEPPATVPREERAVGTGQQLISPLAEPVSPSANIPESQQSTTPAAQIDAAKLKEFRERLRQYSNVILPKQGGMLPSEGIGGAPNKLRAFALKFTGGSDVEKLTLVQWESLFDFLDGFKEGPKELVKYINESIGAK